MSVGKRRGIICSNINVHIGQGVPNAGAARTATCFPAAGQRRWDVRRILMIIVFEVVKQRGWVRRRRARGATLSAPALFGFLQAD